MSQTAMRSPPVAVADAPKPRQPRTTPQLVIGAISTNVPMPAKQRNPLEGILTDLPVGASVPIGGADVKYVRNQVATYRRSHALPNGCFSVAEEGELVRVWRRK